MPLRRELASTSEDADDTATDNGADLGERDGTAAVMLAAPSDHQVAGDGRAPEVRRLPD